jgi:hypothetical protein
MAYVDDPNKNQNEANTMQPLSPSGGQPQGDAGGAPQGGDSTAGMGQGQAAGGSTAPQTAPSPTQAQKPSSGMFTNIRSYLQANQDGGSRVAGAVQGNIQNQAQQGQARLGTVASEFQQKMDQASGRAATEEGRQQAIQDVTAFAQREGGVDLQAQMTEGFGEQDFTNILNKQYQGIERADQTQSFADAQKFYDRLQRSIAAAQDPTQTGSVLKDAFGRQAPYTRGMSNLDSLFYDASDEARAIRSGEEFQGMLDVPQESMSGLRDQTQEMLNARRQAIQDMVNQAQTGFSDVATGRAAAIEDRLTGVEQNWDNISNYFRDRLRGQTGNIGLTEDEARILGITTGDQFFNLTGDEHIDNLIRSREFDRQRLISQDEQGNLARLQALSEMAGLQGDRAFSTDYGADLAGSMTALDALDTENVREQLNQAMGDFRNLAAQDTTGTGAGHSSYKQFVWNPKNAGWRSVGVGAQAQQSARLEDILSQAGYQFQQAGQDLQGSTDYLRDLSAAQAPSVTGRLDDYGIGLDNANILTGDKGILNPSDPLGNVAGLADAVGQTGANLYNQLISNPVQSLVSPIDNIIGGNFLSSAISAPGTALSKASSMLTGSKSEKARAEAEANFRAQQAAAQDLQKRLQQTLDTSGFANVARVSEGDETRRQALLDLLAGLDKTNV